MKNLMFIFPLLFLSLLLSCNEDPIQAENKIYPNDSIDVNDDGTYDYYIKSEVLATMDEPSSMQSNRRTLFPLNGNEFFYRLGTDQSGQFSTSTIFGLGGILQQDFVGEDYSGPYNWGLAAVTLISLNTVNSVSDPNWKVCVNFTYTEDDEFYVGLKLNNVNPTQIAWICLKFNMLTGAYLIVDKAHTAESSLVMTR